MPSETSIRYREEDLREPGPPGLFAVAQVRWRRYTSSYMLLFVCVVRGGTRWTASPTRCCPPTAGRGATWLGWILNRSTASSCPPAAGSGRGTGMWIRPVEGNPARLGWERNTWPSLLFPVVSLSFSWGLPPPQGWEYAVDFPANFSPDKKWNSCVRRRRLDPLQEIRRTRQLGKGLDTLLTSVRSFGCHSSVWSRWGHMWDWGSREVAALQIPLDHPRKPPLPLCDISCGGWEMSDQSGRYPYLWGVSQQGQVSSLLQHKLYPLLSVIHLNKDSMLLLWFCFVYSRVTTSLHNSVVHFNQNILWTNISQWCLL